MHFTVLEYIASLNITVRAHKASKYTLSINKTATKMHCFHKYYSKRTFCFYNTTGIENALLP
jgi:hypothetical protein